MFGFTAPQGLHQSDGAILPIAAGILLIWLANHYVGRKKTMWPQVPWSLPFIGNFWEIEKPENIVHKLHEWADMYSSEHGVYQLNMMGIDYLVLCREDVNLQVQKQRPTKVYRNANLRSAIRSVNAEGLFAAEGANWKQDKRISAPALNHASIVRYFPSVRILTQRLVERWTDISKQNGAIVVNQEMHKVFVDLAGLMFFGEDFDTLRNPGKASAAKMLHSVGRTVIFRMLSPVWYWKIPLIGQYLDGGGFAIRGLTKFIENIVDNFESKKDNEGYSTFAEKLVGVNKRDSDKLSKKRMIGNILTMFVGSTDSSTSTMTTNLWLIASDETGLQEELAAEVLKVDLAKLSVDEMKEAFPRLRSFVYESQRIYSTTPFLMFTAKEEIPFLKSTVPAGTEFISLQRYTGYNPNAPAASVKLGPKGEQAGEYCPRRWLSEDGQSVKEPDTKHGGFLMFGHGARSCPGRSLAEAESLYFLASLLTKFKISLEPGHPPVGRSYTTSTETVDRDVRLVLTLR